MAAARNQSHKPRPSPLAIFELQAWAAAYLCWTGYRDFHAAVDQLQADAEAQGLVRTHGQDRIQQIIAAGFAEGMPPCE